MCSLLTDYLEDNELLPRCQSTRSTVVVTQLQKPALLKVYFDFTDAIDSGEITLLGLLDMEAVAFRHCGSCDTLLDRLNNLARYPLVLHWSGSCRI